MIHQMYGTSEYPLRDQLRSEHALAWQMIAESGPFWSGYDRVAMAAETRNALTCELCRQRKLALSPNMVQGTHDTDSHLPLVVIDAIHRLQSDPARYTHADFRRLIDSGISIEQYVEMVSVVSTTVIIDGLHDSLSIAKPQLPTGSHEPPMGQGSVDLVADGAWVPLSPRSDRPDSLGISRSANILRSMGTVPAAIELFFQVFRNHYVMAKAALDLPRAQIEYVAARVSAVNECFY